MKIESWKTAIYRNNPSVPIKTTEPLLELNNTILDYGCGRGFDFNYLKNKGFNIVGFDKYIEPYTSISVLEESYDVIYCNYVLNVIPYESERIAVLKQLDKMLKEEGKLFITVRSKNRGGKQKPYLDGVVTIKNTFQKYFSKVDIEELINKVFIDCKIEYLNIGADNLLLQIKRRKGV